MLNSTENNLPKGYYISTLIFVCMTIFLIQQFNYTSTINIRSTRPAPKATLRKHTSNRHLNGAIKLSKACERMVLNVSYPKPSIVASFGQGRTANQLCYFASGYALWREYGVFNFLEKEQLDILGKTFVLPELNEDNDNSSYYLWREGKLYRNRNSSSK